jgi:hypothetical protein
LSAILVISACSDSRTPEQLTDALFTAVTEGDCVQVKRLIEKGADVNGQGHPSGDLPLRIAAIRGHVECVRALLDAGADPTRTTSTTTGITRMVFRPVISVQAALHLLKQAKETPPALLPMMHPSLKRTLESGVTVEQYEEIIRMLEEAERQQEKGR